MRARLSLVSVVSAVVLVTSAGAVVAIEPTSETGAGPSHAATWDLPGTTVRLPQAHDGEDSPTRTTTGAPGGTLIFEGSPAGAWPANVWTMNTTGGSLDQITTSALGTGDRFPSWSPGGTLVTFTRDMSASTTDLVSDIFTANADGTGVRRLTTTTAADYTSSFSPDGSRIVFTSQRHGNPEIYTMRIDGTDVRRLTDHPAYDSQAIWSPDGAKIAFVSDRMGATDVYTMNPDGSGVFRLTLHAADDFSPSWTPDGFHIVFNTTRNGGYDVYKVRASDRTSLANLSDETGNVFYPALAPDGSRIYVNVNGSTSVDIAYLSAGTVAAAIGAPDEDELFPELRPVPDFPLVDAKFSSFKIDIEWVFAEGITAGCSAERYCPDNPVTREQMAIFLDRALDLPATATDFFSDDAGRTGEAAINRVAAAGITSGCAANSYCPTTNVSRGQMASFLARAFDLPTATTDYFTDDDGTTHEANINRIRLAGITTGCTPTTYCPNPSVTRGQMAAFLRRALE